MIPLHPSIHSSQARNTQGERLLNPLVVSDFAVAKLYRTMRHSKPGFSLIEILIAVAISSIVSLILYNAFSQTNRVVQQVRSMIADTSDTLSSYAQLEKDFSAIFIPFPEPTSEQKPAAQQESATTAQKPAQPAPKPQQPESKKVEITPFKTTTKEGKLATISFVTTNAFLVLDEAASRVVRVTYALKAQEEGEKKLYTLWREEVPYDQKTEAEKKATKPAHAYPLIRNISEFSAKFSSVQCKEDMKELVTLTEWGTDLQKKQCPEGIAPQNVELTWDVTDSTTQRVVSYTFATTIPAAYCKPEKQTAPVSKPAEPPAKPQQPAGKGSPATQPQTGAAPQPKTSKLNIILGGGAKK